jgi:site-specific DNA-methyltransferase (adenine-specific)
MLREYVKVGEVEKKKFGEVMTPLELVKEMLNTLPDEVWTNPNLKWLDPANGTGPYPSMVIYKLMNGLKEWEPNDEKRYKHIVENMIYVCELQPKNMFLYMCAIDPFDTYNLNIYTGSFLEEGFDIHMKEVWGVDKFDIVMGNPPYQEMDGGAKASAKPIYNIFTEKSIKLSDRVVFITPSRWFAGGKGLDSYRKMMLSRKDIKIIKHFENEHFDKNIILASDIFNNGIEITGGVSYFLIDKSYCGDCLLNENMINLSKYDIVVLPKNYSILEKIKNFGNISSICDGSNYFGVDYREGRGERIVDDKIDDNYIKCYVSKSKGFQKWINIEFINNKDISKFRIATTRTGKHSNIENISFGNIFPIYPKECLSDAYISFPFNTEVECKSMHSYLNTKFANYLLSLRKIGHDIKPDTLKWIPMVPFDREWTDENLFEYFELTEDEKNLILGK